MASSIFSSALGLLPVQTNTLPVNAPPSVFVRYAAVSHPTGSYTTAAAANIEREERERERDHRDRMSFVKR